MEFGKGQEPLNFNLEEGKIHYFLDALILTCASEKKQ
jgi:hypothetical protein